MYKYKFFSIYSVLSSKYCGYVKYITWKAAVKGMVVWAVLGSIIGFSIGYFIYA